MIKIKKKNELCMNVFSNISEFYNYIKKTPRRPTAGKCSEENGNKSWAGTSSLEEAYELLLNGDKDLYKKFQEQKDIKIEKLLGNVINKNKIKNDVVGFQPNVPNYLLGIPTNMINEIPTKLSQKIINLVLCMSVSAGVSSDTLQNIGMKYAQVIDLLEKGGYRCNLYIAHTGEHNNEKNMCLIKIKTDREPFNLKKCVFPIAHPAMFRRVMFKWMEICDIDNEMTSGWASYGSPVSDKEYIKNTVEKNLKCNVIVWNFQNTDYQSVGVPKILEDLEKNYGIKLGGD
jgi:hypothetical protein